MNRRIRLDQSEKLIFSHKEINDDEVIEICNKLLQDTTIKWLDLSYNKISDKSCGVISNLLIKNITLRYLIIANNNIGDDGIIQIMEALTHYNKSLKLLIACNNNFGNMSAIHISNCIKVNNTLQVLIIHDTNIDKDGSQIIIDSLIFNITLRYLYIYKEFNSILYYKSHETILCEWLSQ